MEQERETELAAVVNSTRSYYSSFTHIFLATSSSKLNSSGANTAQYVISFISELGGLETELAAVVNSTRSYYSSFTYIFLV